MVIVNTILYFSTAWCSILSFNHFFIVKILTYWFVMKNIGNYRTYDIFFNFRFTEKMIFPSIAENQDNITFTLSVFTKMLFFMQFQSYLNMAFIIHTTICLRKLCVKLWQASNICWPHEKRIYQHLLCYDVQRNHMLFKGKSSDFHIFFIKNVWV